jgi:hypothetical protein
MMCVELRIRCSQPSSRGFSDSLLSFTAQSRRSPEVRHQIAIVLPIQRKRDSGVGERLGFTGLSHQATFEGHTCRGADGATRRAERQPCSPMPSPLWSSFTPLKWHPSLLRNRSQSLVASPKCPLILPLSRTLSFSTTSRAMLVFWLDREPAKARPLSRVCSEQSERIFLSGSRRDLPEASQCSREPAHNHSDYRHGHCRGRSPTKPAQPPKDDEFLHDLPLDSDDHHHAHDRNSHDTINHSAPI